MLEEAEGRIDLGLSRSDGFMIRNIRLIRGRFNTVRYTIHLQRKNLNDPGLCGRKSPPEMVQLYGFLQPKRKSLNCNLNGPRVRRIERITRLTIVARSLFNR